MAFCTNCGAKIEDDAKFCAECGTRVESAPAAPVETPTEAPAETPVETPAAPVNDYIYSAPTTDYTYTPASQDSGSTSGSYTAAPQQYTYSYDPAAPGPVGAQPPRPPRDIPRRQPARKEKSVLPFVLIGVAVVAVVVLLIAILGGKNKKNNATVSDPYVGLYICTHVALDDYMVSVDEFVSYDFTIELFNNGRCAFVTDGSTDKGTYEIESDGTLHVDLLGGDSLDGRITDDLIVFENAMDTGVDFYFYKEGAAAPDLQTPTVTEDPAAEEADSVIGSYIGSHADYDGYTVKAEDVGGFTIELLAGNKCMIMVDGESISGTYELESDGSIYFDFGSDGNYYGALMDNSIILNAYDDDDTEVLFYFYKEGTPVPEIDTSAVEDELYSWWNGEWYGWWVVYEGNGKYAELEDYFYDACATIDVRDNTGLIDLWDVDCVEGQNIGYIDVVFTEGTTNKGRMISTGGSFYDGVVDAGDWDVDPGNSVVSRFDSMIMIDGMYYDSADSENWIHYYVFLRPWGMSWEDVRSDSCDDMPYYDMMPAYYDSWYVPNMNGTMPQFFDFGDEAA